MEADWAESESANNVSNALSSMDNPDAALDPEPSCSSSSFVLESEVEHEDEGRARARDVVRMGFLKADFT